ncbi:MAG: maleylpyruvate isomerase N-terminal domain-containing protein, partial [Acidimicrobiia bacterium]
MSEISERYERITGQFSDRVRGVAAGDWDRPSPCEGWRARDVVGHLTEWIPGFFGAQGVAFPPIPSVADDPVGAWEAVREAIG